jgi:hypothetical protein
MLKGLPLVVATIGVAHLVQAHQSFNAFSKTGKGPGAHAPISVMGDHTHAKGQWMLSYRYMHMDMDGLQDGSDRLSRAEAFDRDDHYAVVPDSMTMQMHMLGLMYAPSDTLTLMAMLPITEREMQHTVNADMPAGFTAGGGNSFTTQTEGLGDLKLTALYTVFNTPHTRTHLGLGLSLPTGSISETGRTPSPAGYQQQQLPAAMQPGSGTVDVLPSLTVRHQLGTAWSLGGQVGGTLRTHENDQGYHLGHQIHADLWSAYELTQWLAPTLRLGYAWEGELSGTQKNVNQTTPPMIASGAMTGGNPIGQTVPTAYSENYGGQQLELGFGANFKIPSGIFEGHRLAAECTLPLRQNTHGLKLRTAYSVTVGWQYSF